MKTVNKEILLRQISANDYADEIKMAVGDAIEEYADTYMGITSISELAEQLGLSEKKTMNLLTGDVDVKLSDIARYAYMMGCHLRIALEHKPQTEEEIKIGGTDG